MTTKDFIISLFCLVDERMGDSPKRSDATMLSLATRFCQLKHLSHRVSVYLETHLAFVSALFNLLLGLNRILEPEDALDDRLLHIAQYSLWSSTNG